MNQTIVLLRVLSFSRIMSKTMTRTFILAIPVLVALLFSTGCSSKPAQPTFHVVSVDTCDRPQLVGTVGKMRYALNVAIAAVLRLRNGGNRCRARTLGEMR